MNNPISVGILLFNDVEVLDFAGPFEVLSSAQASSGGSKCFSVKTVSQDGNLLTASYGLKVQPDYSFASAPNFDIVVVPGGYGAREVELHNKAVIEWLKEQYRSCQIIAGVCTGAFLLAEAGILDGIECTTHRMRTEELAGKYPKLRVRKGARYVDEGRVITAAGVSAGIDMALHIVERLFGCDVALKTANRMEYAWLRQEEVK